MRPGSIGELLVGECSGDREKDVQILIEKEASVFGKRVSQKHTRNPEDDRTESNAQTLYYTSKKTNKTVPNSIHVRWVLLFV